MGLFKLNFYKVLKTMFIIGLLVRFPNQRTPNQSPVEITSVTRSISFDDNKVKGGGNRSAGFLCFR